VALIVWQLDLQLPMQSVPITADVSLNLSGRGVQQVGGFLQSSTNKTDFHDITEILLKVALNTIKQTKTVKKKCM